VRKSYYELALPSRAGFPAVERVSRLKGGDILSGVVGEGVVDPVSWEAPPHAAFANLGYPARAEERHVASFMKTYGVLRFGQAGGLSGPIHMPMQGKVFLTSIAALRFAQDQLRSAWRRPSGEHLRSLWLPENLQELGTLDLSFTLLQRRQRVELCLADVWTFIRLILVRDVRDGLARFCANENCEHPFFVANRRDQKFCGRDCRNAQNQRNFQRRRKP
jgi:hypothetical protein